MASPGWGARELFLTTYVAAPARAPVSHKSWSCRGPLPHNRGVTEMKWLIEGPLVQAMFSSPSGSRSGEESI